MESKIMMKIRKVGPVIGLIAVIWSQVTNAGTIQSITMANAPGGSGTGSCSAPDPNNDNAVGASPNTCTIDKIYRDVDYIDMVFAVFDSGGTTEYQFQEFMFNQTGRGWHDFHFDLGFGTGAGFINSGNGDFLDFDEPAKDSPVSSTAFANHMFDNAIDALWFDFGKCFVGTTCEFTFAVDVPDHDSPGRIPTNFLLHDAVGTVIGYQFTLRQTPSIPEPMSVLLVNFGLAGLGFARRRLSS